MAKPRRIGNPPRRIPAITDWSAPQAQHQLPMDPYAFAVPNASEPQYAQEQAPMQGPGNPWLESLAGLANVQTPAYHPGLTTGDQFGTALLAALARTVGEHQQQQMNERAAANAYQMKQAADRNAENLKASQSAAASQAARALATHQSMLRRQETADRIAQETAAKGETLAKEPKLVEQTLPSGEVRMVPESLGLIKKAAPKEVDYSRFIRTTRSGHKFMNMSLFKGNAANDAAQWAAGNGVVPVDAQQFGEVVDVESALRNLDTIQGQVQGFLPKDAAGRLQLAPGIRMAQALQTKPAIAAFNAFRAAAIRNVRAMSGSKGLRINQAEIELAVKNDIPNVTDTWETALQKMENVRNLLRNASEPIVNPDWGAPTDTGGKLNKTPPPGGW